MIFIDLIILIVLFVVGMGFRMLFRRPRNISASSELGTLVLADATGFHGSSEKFREMISKAENGAYVNDGSSSKEK